MAKTKDVFPVLHIRQKSIDPVGESPERAIYGVYIGHGLEDDIWLGGIYGNSDADIGRTIRNVLREAGKNSGQPYARDERPEKAPELPTGDQPFFDKYCSDDGVPVRYFLDPKSSPLVPSFEGKCWICQKVSHYSPYPGDETHRKAYANAGMEWHGIDLADKSKSTMTMEEAARGGRR